MGNAAIEPMSGNADDNGNYMINSSDKNKTNEQQVNNNNAPDTSSTEKGASTNPNSPVPEEEEEESPVQILLQFIPYYGQGDPANDSLVRSTLTGLSSEDIDSRDQYDNTCLLLACQYKCEDLVRIMLNKGADPNAVNDSGACCLHFACYSGSASKSIAKLLLQNGANPDTTESSYGCTPLHYCASNGDIDFCKLLLSYGAQIATLDSYQYSCADYARDAQFPELEAFLRGKIKAWEAQQNLRGAGTGSGGNVRSFMTPTKSSGSMLSMSPVAGGGNDNLPAIPIDWQVNYDANTQTRYYNNIRTDEVLWEQELLDRLAMAGSGGGNSKATIGSSSKLEGIAESLSPSKIARNAALIAKASRARLVAFFSQHDPTRLTDIDAILAKYKGNEQAMLSDLCGEYKVAENAEMAAFAAKLEELNETEEQAERIGGTTSSPLGKGMSSLSLNSSFQLGKSTPVINRGSGSSANTPVAERGIDPSVVQQQLAQRVSAMESQFDEERAVYRATISEKEGIIAGLESTLDVLKREKSSIEHDKEEIASQAEKVQASGGNALHAAEEKYNQLLAEFDKVKAELETATRDLAIEKEKLSSLEGTISSLQSGEADKIAAEQKAADERARLQRERDEKYAQELREAENSKRRLETKLRAEMAAAKAEAETIETNLRKTSEQYKRTKESEIDAMNKEMGERKSDFAQKLSAAQMMAEDAVKRADAAEALQRSMAEEVAEAQKISLYNAQLHKDLNREQAARKRLHNEMEDMKGKIRVYVRIRPISNSELERGSTEAAIKDGKLHVQVNLADKTKKHFDFDAVFAGKEGNSQTDVFRDTKHLMMSVIDGYNVCIFAYGQTGAGKSYTMIGAAEIANCLKENGDFDDQAGITPRAVSELFRLLNERSAQVSFIVEVQMFQLYRDGLDDLLQVTKNEKKENLDIKRKPHEPGAPDKAAGLKITLAEHSHTGLVVVDGAETCLAESASDVMKIFAKGASRRTTSSTQMNAESSRSHLICCVTVRLTNRKSGVESFGKLTLVDLAGSERVDKSGATGDQLKEAQSINKSLSALGDVIAALTSGTKHVPYRNHPLTMLMSDSLGGNAKTLMFVNASPADYNEKETVSSLNFAVRCKDITNAVSTGPGVQAAQMSALKKELAKMKKGGGAGAATSSSNLKNAGGGLARPTTAAHPPPS